MTKLRKYQVKRKKVKLKVKFEGGQKLPVSDQLGKDQASDRQKDR